MEKDITAGPADIALSQAAGVASATIKIAQQFGIFKVTGDLKLELDATLAAKAVFDSIRTHSPVAIQGLEQGLEQIVLDALAKV